MTATYLLLNLFFLFLAWLFMARFKLQPTKPRPEFFLALIALYLMMLAFNTYLTTLPIVQYDWQKTLGQKIISWPIEDLAYLVVALYAAPLLWERLKEYYDEQTTLDQPTSVKSADKPRKARSSKAKRKARRKHR